MTKYNEVDPNGTKAHSEVFPSVTVFKLKHALKFFWIRFQEASATVALPSNSVLEKQ